MSINIEEKVCLINDRVNEVGEVEGEKRFDRYNPNNEKLSPGYIRGKW